jgi:hypothetical protein
VGRERGGEDPVQADRVVAAIPGVIAAGRADYRIHR